MVLEVANKLGIFTDDDAVRLAVAFYSLVKDFLVVELTLVYSCVVGFFEVERLRVLFIFIVGPEVSAWRTPWSPSGWAWSFEMVVVLDVEFMCVLCGVVEMEEVLRRWQRHEFSLSPPASSSAWWSSGAGFPGRMVARCSPPEAPQRACAVG